MVYMNLTAWIISVMEQLGYWGIALLMFLDNVFPPIPSEIIMPSAGYAASQGELVLIGVIIAGCLGSLFAAAVLYWIGYQFKQEYIFRWVDRYGKYLFIKSADVKKSLDWFEQYGHRIVFFGRMIPARLRGSARRACATKWQTSLPATEYGKFQKWFLSGCNSFLPRLLYVYTGQYVGHAQQSGEPVFRQRNMASFRNGFNLVVIVFYQGCIDGSSRFGSVFFHPYREVHFPAFQCLGNQVADFHFFFTIQWSDACG
jgi:membrane protein YqaA with SNARE-associated domain